MDQHFPKYPCIVLLRADAAYAAAFAQTDPTLAALLPLEDDVDTGESAAGETPTPAKRARFKGILELPTGVWAVEDHTLYPESWRYGSRGEQHASTGAHRSIDLLQVVLHALCRARPH